MDNCGGQSYDGAGNIAGRYTGVLTLIHHQFPKFILLLDIFILVETSHTNCWIRPWMTRILIIRYLFIKKKLHRVFNQWGGLTGAVYKCLLPLVPLDLFSLPKWLSHEKRAVWKPHWSCETSVDRTKTYNISKKLCSHWIQNNNSLHVDFTRRKYTRGHD